MNGIKESTAQSRQNRREQSTDERSRSAHHFFLQCNAMQCTGECWAQLTLTAVLRISLPNTGKHWETPNGLKKHRLTMGDVSTQKPKVTHKSKSEVCGVFPPLVLHHAPALCSCSPAAIDLQSHSTQHELSSAQLTSAQLTSAQRSEQLTASGCLTHQSIMHQIVTSHRICQRISTPAHAMQTVLTVCGFGLMGCAFILGR